MKERNKYQDIFPSQDLVIQTKYCKMILCGGRVCLTEQQNPGIKVKMKKGLKYLLDVMWFNLSKSLTRKYSN